MPKSPAEAALAEPLQLHLASFDARMGVGGASTRVFFAPGRVNLFGGHLDYNGGPVMPTAINRGTFLAIRRRADRMVRLESQLDSQGLTFDLDHVPKDRSGRWVDYPVGVVRELLEQRRVKLEAGVEPNEPTELQGLDVLYGGNLPVGAGLSSSASICVGTAFALNEVWELGLDRMEQVHCALEAERRFVGVQCGIMDPYSIGLAKPGHLLWLDCKDRSYQHLPIDYSELSIVVANSGVQRELAAGEFNKRVQQCQDAFLALQPFMPEAECLRDITPEIFEKNEGSMEPVLARRARHVVYEVVRTMEAREALFNGDYVKLGGFMTQTHKSLRDHFEVSSAELDLLVEAATECEGCFGSRLTGAGFGGCTVMLVHPDRVPEVVAHVQSRYSQAKGWVPQVEVFQGDEGPREWFRAAGV